MIKFFTNFSLNHIYGKYCGKKRMQIMLSMSPSSLSIFTWVLIDYNIERNKLLNDLIWLYMGCCHFYHLQKHNPCFLAISVKKWVCFCQFQFQVYNWQYFILHWQKYTYLCICDGIDKSTIKQNLYLMLFNAGISLFS